MLGEHPSRSGWLTTALLAICLFGLNFYVCHELFHLEYLRFMGSIEGAFIGLSRYALAHWNDLTWFPLWYAGIPYQTTYPPLLHVVVAAVAALRGTSTAYAYHAVTALAYCLGPVALFALTRRLTGSRWAGFAAGVIWSSVSLSAWLVPRIAADMGSPFFPRRLDAMVRYGEGPHVASITLLIIALLCLDIAMTKRRAPFFFLATLAFAATATTNWLGAFAILLVVVPYTLAHLGSGGWKWRDLALLALIGVAAYCLAVPWIPPSTIAVLQMNAKTANGDYSNAYRYGWMWGPAALIALAGMKTLVRRWARQVQFAVLFALLMMLVTLPDEWWSIAIVPQAERYHLEMEMALAILAAMVAHAMLRNRPRWIAIGSMGALLVALILPLHTERSHARDYLLLPQDIHSTIEWKTAHWLNEHWTGGRVMLPGSSAFWFTAFSDTPQLWGIDQSLTDYELRVGQFVIFRSELAGPGGTEDAVLWLKALGVQAVAVSGPASTEIYKPFPNPKKFEGVLEPLWRGGIDDVIYRVGRGPESLARVIPRSALVSKTPSTGLDVDPLRPYIAALDEPGMPHAEFRWRNMHRADIAADLEAGQVLSVQMAWHKGWHAVANGRPTPILRDAIGLMYIDPAISGPCKIEMAYDGGAEMRAARLISPVTAFLLAIACVPAVLKRHWPRFGKFARMGV